MIIAIILFVLMVSLPIALLAYFCYALSAYLHARRRMKADPSEARAQYKASCANKLIAASALLVTVIAVYAFLIINVSRSISYM